MRFFKKYCTVFWFCEVGNSECSSFEILFIEVIFNSSVDQFGLPQMYAKHCNMFLFAHNLIYLLNPSSYQKILIEKMKKALWSWQYFIYIFCFYVFNLDKKCLTYLGLLHIRLHIICDQCIVRMNDTHGWCKWCHPVRKHMYTKLNVWKVHTHEISLIFSWNLLVIKTFLANGKF